MAPPARFSHPRGRSVASSEFTGAADRSRERLAVPGQSRPLPSDCQNCEVLRLNVSSCVLWRARGWTRWADSVGRELTRWSSGAGATASADTSFRQK